MQPLLHSELSKKKISELFTCHKKLAKQILKNIKDVKSDNITYKKAEIENGNIFVSIFLYKGGSLIRRLNYWFVPNGKCVLQIHFFEIEQNVVIREDFLCKGTSYVNKYDLEGNVLVRMYNNSLILEMYEYDSNNVLTKMIYAVNTKLDKMYKFEFNEQNQTYNVVETDMDGRKIATYQNIPKSKYMRPKELNLKIYE